MPEPIDFQARYEKDCPYCADIGWVVAYSRSAPVRGERYDEMGPCPFCQRGWRIEFGPKSHWGGDGFWRGRPAPELPRVNGSRPLPFQQQREALQQLLSQLGLVGNGGVVPTAEPSPTAASATSEPRSATSTGGFRPATPTSER